MYTYNLEKIVHMWPLVNKKSHRVSIYGDFEYKIWRCPRLYLEGKKMEKNTIRMIVYNLAKS